MLNQLDDDPFAPDHADDDPFAPDQLEEQGVMKQTRQFKLLVVDDDESVHHITKLILKRSEFPGWKPELLHAMSGREAKELLGINEDIAVVLLDVIMESDHAGLDVAQYIRGDLNNRTTQIIIRTGQPGAKADSGILATHDVNDFRTKSELTSDKLYTCVLAAVRNHEHIRSLEIRNRRLHDALACLGRLHQALSVESGEIRQSYHEFLRLLIGDHPAAATEGKKPTAAWFGFWNGGAEGVPEVLATSSASGADSEPPPPLPAPHGSVLSSVTLDSGWHRDDDGITGWMRIPGDGQLAVFHAPRSDALRQEEEPLVMIALSRLCGIPHTAS